MKNKLDVVGQNLSLEPDDDGREDEKSDCLDTSDKCGKFATDKFCASNGLVRKKCMASCNLCGKLIYRTLNII